MRRVLARLICKDFRIDPRDCTFGAPYRRFGLEIQPITVRNVVN
jgi:hypothetical protein